MYSISTIVLYLPLLNACMVDMVNAVVPKSTSVRGSCVYHTVPLMQCFVHPYAQGPAPLRHLHNSHSVRPLLSNASRYRGVPLLLCRSAQSAKGSGQGGVSFFGKFPVIVSLMSKDDEATLWLVTMKQNVYAYVCIVAMHMYMYND